MRLSDSWAQEPEAVPNEGAWDAIAVRKAAEAPVALQAQVQASRARKIALGVGLLVTALVMTIKPRKKGAR